MRCYFLYKVITLAFALVFVEIENAAAQEPVCDEASGLCSVNPKLDPSELLADFPGILDDSDDHDDALVEVLCPFLRMIRRTQVLRDKISISIPGGERYGIFNIVRVIHDTFPFSLRAYSSLVGVAVSVAVGQLFRFATVPGKVNLEQLWNAPLISHECGLVS